MQAEIPEFIIEGSIIDAEGNPRQGVMVYAYDERGKKAGTSDSNWKGYFEISARREVRYIQFGIDDQQVVVEGPWTESIGVAVDLSKIDFISIEGYVRDEFGDPVEDVMIYADDVKGRQIAYGGSESSGFFRILANRPVGFLASEAMPEKIYGPWAADVNVNLTVWRANIKREIAKHQRKGNGRFMTLWAMWALGVLLAAVYGPYRNLAPGPADLFLMFMTLIGVPGLWVAGNRVDADNQNVPRKSWQKISALGFICFIPLFVFGRWFLS